MSLIAKNTHSKHTHTHTQMINSLYTYRADEENEINNKSSEICLCVVVHTWKIGLSVRMF